jgi:hypothetical protein
MSQGCNNVNVEPTVIGGGDGSTAYDAFGRLRVSNPLTIFDSKNVMSKNNLFDEALTRIQELFLIQQINPL